MKIHVGGPDGFGKSTLCDALSKALNAELIKFPNVKFESGQRIYQILNGELPFEPMSFQALQIVNRLETYETLDPKKTYVMDRGKLSGIIYALVDGLPEEWVRKTADYIPNPDVTVIITGRPYKQDSDIYSDEGYQRKVKELYKKEGKKLDEPVYSDRVFLEEKKARLEAELQSVNASLLRYTIPVGKRAEEVELC